MISGLTILVLSGAATIRATEPILAGFPLYSLIMVLFMSGFGYATDLHRLPLPTMVTKPFLTIALIHGYPNLALVADSALGMVCILIGGEIGAAVLVAVLTVIEDESNPRLFGIVSDDAWPLIGGAAAWVGYAHLLGLLACFGAVAAIWFLLQLLQGGYLVRSLLYFSGTQVERDAPNSNIHNLPWGLAVTSALVGELVLQQIGPHLWPHFPTSL